MDRSISRSYGEQTATAVELAVNLVLSQLSLGRDRHIEVDVTVAGVQVDIRRQIVRNLQRDAAVSGFQAPAICKRRAVGGAHIDVAIPGLEIELVKSAIRLNMPIPGLGAQLAINALEVHRAVAGVQIHLTLKVGNFNPAIPSAQLDVPFARHLEDDVNTA